MEVWGITGLLGAGKSTAIGYLRSMGYPSIDADQLSRLVIDRKTEIGKEGFEKIFRAFGSEVLNKVGDLDKVALRKKMLLNPTDKEKLEAILDPLVVKQFEKTMREWKSSGTPFAFVEGSRLAESGFEKLLSGLIRATTSYDKRVTRVAKRDSMGKLEVEMMFKFQDDDIMRRLSKIEWKNDGKPTGLHSQIEEFIRTRKTHKRT